MILTIKLRLREKEKEGIATNALLEEREVGPYAGAWVIGRQLFLITFRNRKRLGFPWPNLITTKIVMRNDKNTSWCKA